MALNTKVTVATSSTLLPLVGNSNLLVIQNRGVFPITVHFGDGPAVANEGVVLPTENSSFAFESGVNKLGKAYAIAVGGSAVLSICQF